MPVSHPPGAAAPAPSRSSDSLNLPDPRHAQRVPPHIGRAQLERIRRAAFLLPQVVTPADYSDDAGNPTVQLDRLGLVLLQKAAAGARPSRWIDPALMDSALAHLEVVGSGGTTLPQMLERRAALEANGVVREGGGFVREVQKPLSVPVPEGRPWSITVAFRVPVDAELAWAFHRSGNLEALRAELGAPPPHPQAEDLRAHLAALVARSHAYQPRRLELLLPRLQAECAAPVPLPAMKAACTRAQDRWEHRVTELDMLEGLNSELAFQRYPDSFETARHLQRSVTLYVGPPNSGKTHAAFERLAQALDGAYLAPLRLLALEGRDRLVGRGVPCSLLTGEESCRPTTRASISSTIEMVDTREAGRRGGDRRGADAVRQLARLGLDAGHRRRAGQRADHHLLRLRGTGHRAPARRCAASAARTPGLRAQAAGAADAARRCPWPPAGGRRGGGLQPPRRADAARPDRRNALGATRGVIYGALPPEVRRREAERFASGGPATSWWPPTPSAWA
jgi:ATP-dependent RNA helicase SUPV3L1/SUV3